MWFSSDTSADAEKNGHPDAKEKMEPVRRKKIIDAFLSLSVIEPGSVQTGSGTKQMKITLEYRIIKTEQKKEKIII